MLSTELSPSLTSTTGFFKPAEVIDTCLQELQVLVRPLDADPPLTVWARLALPAMCNLAPGDRVLVGGASWDEPYVLGVLDVRGATSSSDSQATATTNNVVRGPGDSCVAVQGPEGQERLQVYSQQRELLFEYDPRSGKSRLNVPIGDLELCVSNGDLALAAKGDVRIQGARVEIAGKHGVRTAVETALGNATAIELRPQQAAISSNRLTVAARRADATIETANYAGKRYEGRIGAFCLVVGRMEVVASTIVEKTKNLYSTVAGLCQVKAGRMRSIVDSTFAVKARRAHLKTDEDFKIKGRKIDLA